MTWKSRVLNAQADVQKVNLNIDKNNCDGFYPLFGKIEIHWNEMDRMSSLPSTKLSNGLKTIT